MLCKQLALEGSNIDHRCKRKYRRHGFWIRGAVGDDCGSWEPQHIQIDLGRAQGERLRRLFAPIDVFWKHNVEGPIRVV